MFCIVCETEKNDSEMLEVDIDNPENQYLLEADYSSPITDIGICTDCFNESFEEIEYDDINMSDS